MSGIVGVVPTAAACDDGGNSNKPGAGSANEAGAGSGASAGQAGNSGDCEPREQTGGGVDPSTEIASQAEGVEDVLDRPSPFELVDDQSEIGGNGGSARAPLSPVTGRVEHVDEVDEVDEVPSDGTSEVSDSIDRSNEGLAQDGATASSEELGLNGEQVPNRLPNLPEIIRAKGELPDRAVRAAEALEANDLRLAEQLLEEARQSVAEMEAAVATFKDNALPLLDEIDAAIKDGGRPVLGSSRKPLGLPELPSRAVVPEAGPANRAPESIADLNLIPVAWGVNALLAEPENANATTSLPVTLIEGGFAATVVVELVDGGVKEVLVDGIPNKAVFEGVQRALRFVESANRSQQGKPAQSEDVASDPEHRTDRLGITPDTKNGLDGDPLGVGDGSFDLDPDSGTFDFASAFKAPSWNVSNSDPFSDWGTTAPGPGARTLGSLSGNDGLSFEPATSTGANLSFTSKPSSGADGSGSGGSTSEPNYSFNRVAAPEVDLSFGSDSSYDAERQSDSDAASGLGISSAGSSSSSMDLSFDRPSSSGVELSLGSGPTDTDLSSEQDSSGSDSGDFDWGTTGWGDH